MTNSHQFNFYLLCLRAYIRNLIYSKLVYYVNEFCKHQQTVPNTSRWTARIGTKRCMKLKNWCCGRIFAASTYLIATLSKRSLVKPIWTSNEIYFLCKTLIHNDFSYASAKITHKTDTQLALSQNSFANTVYECKNHRLNVSKWFLKRDTKNKEDLYIHLLMEFRKWM